MIFKMKVILTLKLKRFCFFPEKVSALFWSVSGLFWNDSRKRLEKHLNLSGIKVEIFSGIF